MIIYIFHPSPVSFCPWISFCPHINFVPISFCPWKSLNDFTPFTHVLYHFHPRLILPPYQFTPYHFAPWKLFKDLHYLPMSHIIFPLDSFCPHVQLPPYHFAPWISFNDLHYFHMSHIIPPPIILPPPPTSRIIFAPLKLFHDFHSSTHVPYHFAPGFILPTRFILPPGNRLIIYTIYQTLNFAYHTNKGPYNKTVGQARIRRLWHLWLLNSSLLKIIPSSFSTLVT